MADAEVKLNFTASVEQARAAIAEISAAMEKLKATGGVMRPEDAALLNEMQGQLVAYKARLDELDAAYRKLQASGGQANEQALAQIKELQEEVARLTKQQDDLLKKIVDLQVANNELKGATAGVSAETEKAGRDGVRVVRSMRGVVANFIRDLMLGRLAVRELGLALKGLMYSTVVLGAIQLAMDGIMWTWEKIKGVFGKSKEEMKAAEEAAKRAQEQLKNAQEATAAAEKAYAEWKDKLDKDNAAEALSARVEKVAGLFQRQREELDKQLGLVMIQAELEGRMLKDKEAQERHEIALQKLELKRKLLMEEISKEQYDSGVAKLDRRVQGLDNQAKVDAASAELKKIESEMRTLRSAYGDAYVGRDEAIEKRRGMVSDKEVEGARLAMEADKAQLDLAEKRINKLKDEAKGGDFEFDIGDDGKVDFKRSSLTYLNDVLGNGDYVKEIERAVKDLNNARHNARQGELKYNRALAGNDGWKENEAYLEKQKKLLDEISAKYEQLEKRQKDAERRLKNTEETTFIDSLRQDEIFDAEGRVRKAEAVAERRKNKPKEDKARKRGLEEQIKRLFERARAAGETGDKDDDAEVANSIKAFVDKNGKAFEKYNVDVNKLLEACNKLNMGSERQWTKLRALDDKIRDLQRRVDKNLSKS